jgi:hypothetical protein
MMKTERPIVVEMVPLSQMAIAYRLTKPFVRAFQGDIHSLHDLAVWCYTQGLMDGIQVHEKHPAIFNQPEQVTNYEI